MANRSWHTNGGIIGYIITMGILIYAKFFTFNVQRDLAWVLFTFFIAIFGGVFPDLDQTRTLPWRKLFYHRNWFMHSSIPSLIISYFVIYNSKGNEILLPVVAIFNVGVATHLFLDYFPTWQEGNDGNGSKKDNNKQGNKKHTHKKNMELGDIWYGTEWLVEGITGDELTEKLEGTYLIHFPVFLKLFFKRETINKTWTRFYLFLNALILIALAVYMIFLFNGQLP